MTLLTATKSRQVCLLDHLDPIGFRTFLPHLFNETNTLVVPQGAQPSPLDRPDVDENILPT